MVDLLSCAERGRVWVCVGGGRVVRSERQSVEGVRSRSGGRSRSSFSVTHDVGEHREGKRVRDVRERGVE